AIESFHHLHALHRQLSFPSLGTADREYRRARGQIEAGPVPLDPVGFTYVRLLTLPQGNPTGNTLRPGPSDLHVLEIQPPGGIPLRPAFRGNPDRELAARRRLRRRRPDLRLTRYRHR